MQILYKQATKQYIHYDASARRSDLVSDVNEATEMANDLAVSILNRCSKKLKGFESIPAESVKKSASSTLSNSSVKIIKNSAQTFYSEGTPRYLHTGQRHLWHLWKIRAA